MSDQPVSLGLDIGDARTGVARSDALGLLAHPLCTIRTEKTAELVETLVALVIREGAQTVVVGIPYDQSGKEGPQARAVRHTVELLQQRLPDRHFVEIDERFSTQEAERQLLEIGLRRQQRRQVRDQAAAVLILQTWLDRQAAAASKEKRKRPRKSQ